MFQDPMRERVLDVLSMSFSFLRDVSRILSLMLNEAFIYLNKIILNFCNNKYSLYVLKKLI